MSASKDEKFSFWIKLMKQLYEGYGAWLSRDVTLGDEPR